MPASYRPWGRPAVPGDSGQCARACNDHHPSWATYAGVRGPAGLTSCSWRLGMGSVVSWVRPAHPGDSGTCPRATMSTSCPGSLGPLSQSPCCRPAVLDDSPSGLVPAALTYGPGRLGLGSVVLPHPRALPGDSRPALIASGVEQFSLATRARVRFPAGSTSSPGESRFHPRARGIHQLSRVTLDRVRVPAVSTSTPGRLVLVSEGSRRWPALTGDRDWVRRPAGSTSCPEASRPPPIAHGVDQLSRATQARVDSPRCRPGVPEDSRLTPMARGVNQLSWASRALVRVPAGSTSCPG